MVTSGDVVLVGMVLVQLRKHHGRFILADIPGLIEGASSGKGLGHKFLKHVTRTRVLFHCISLEGENLMATYTTVRDELSRYSSELAAKPELIILTKSDATDAEGIDAAQALFKKEGKETVVVSILDDASVKALGDKISAVLGK
jgi:GTP-binding protein